MSAAADQCYRENVVSSVLSTNFVGATNYVKVVNTVASETYPTGLTQGITIDGIAEVRTVTCAP